MPAGDRVGPGKCVVQLEVATDVRSTGQLISINRRNWNWMMGSDVCASKAPPLCALGGDDHHDELILTHGASKRERGSAVLRCPAVVGGLQDGPKGRAARASCVAHCGTQLAVAPYLRHHA